MKKPAPISNSKTLSLNFLERFRLLTLLGECPGMTTRDFRLQNQIMDLIEFTQEETEQGKVEQKSVSGMETYHWDPVVGSVKKEFTLTPELENRLKAVIEKMLPQIPLKEYNTWLVGVCDSLGI